jgi:hypothetical protein
LRQWKKVEKKSEEDKLESIAKDLEESYVDKNIEAAQKSSEKSEGDGLEITRNCKALFTGLKRRAYFEE